MAPAFAASVVLLLAGCAAPGGTAPGGDGGAGGGGLPDSPHKATLEVDGQSFTFAPTVCLTTDGRPTVLGPGVDKADNSPVLLEMNIVDADGFPEGEIFVYLGAEDASSTDSYLMGVIGGGDDYSMGNMMEGFEVETFLRDQDASDTGTGTFVINCEE